MKSYLELEGIYREISSLSDTLSILSWDDAVMMPVKSADSRSEQISTIKSIIHKKITSNNIRDLIIEVEDKFSELSDIQKRNLQLMKKKWIHANAINNELVVKYSKLSSQTENIWRTARANNDFKSLLSPLKELILVTKEISLMKAEHLNCSPYEALIDEYDPNRKISDIENIFGKLKLFLPDFINKIIEKQKSYNIENIRGNFPVDKQRAIGTFLMEKLGFDFNMGRFDVSLHPFCGGHSRDVRITTRYREDNFIPAMMGVIHETGHALYEFGLPIEKFPGQPISEALGMAFHESQSLFIEMQIGRSRPFVNKLSKILPEYYGMQKAFEADNLYKILNYVEPSLIRVDADEVTYPLHIIIRYEIEKALFEGDLQAEDLPSFFNELMKKYLGLRVPNDTNGCMQDIHWPSGSFGYFPSYSLGAIIAAQLFTELKKQEPLAEEQINDFNFDHLLAWLRKNVHNYGSSCDTKEILEKVTGSDINIEFYIKYLIEKF